VGTPFLSLAAAAIVVAATVITAATVVSSAVVAAATEQDQQNDDPAPVATTEAIITHTKYLHMKIFQQLFAAHSKIFRRLKNVQCRKVLPFPAGMV
jgi:hypothetical protein